MGIPSEQRKVLIFRYVSRVSLKDNSKHVILAVGTYKPKDFAAQMNVQVSNAWGIVRAIVDICRKRPDGKYVLVKVLANSEIVANCRIRISLW